MVLKKLPVFSYSDYSGKLIFHLTYFTQPKLSTTKFGQSSTWNMFVSQLGWQQLPEMPKISAMALTIKDDYLHKKFNLNMFVVPCWITSEKDLTQPQEYP